MTLTRIVPGAQSSARHKHSRQDEFVWVVSGEIVLETDEGAKTLRPGMCAGFPAGCGNAHRFVNRSAEDAVLLVVGDRTPFDYVTYPDIDNHARAGADGKYVHTRKDGTPHLVDATARPKASNDIMICLADRLYRPCATCRRFSRRLLHRETPKQANQ